MAGWLMTIAGTGLYTPEEQATAMTAVKMLIDGWPKGEPVGIFTVIAAIESATGRLVTFEGVRWDARQEG